MTDAMTPTTPSVAPDEPSLEWTFDPWREHARRAVVALGAAVTVAVLLVTSGLQALTTAALIAVAATVLGPGYASTRCRIDDTGVARRLAFLWWDRRAWQVIRSARLLPGALVVSPSRRPGVLSAMRELVLPLPRGGERDVLRADVAHRLERHGF
jgi:hypothetical protein